MSQQPVPMTGPDLSAGTLLYLFGDRVVKPAGRVGATQVPYTGARVSESELAVVTFAASFWSLRQAGALELRLVEKKTLGLFRQQHVAVATGAHATRTSGYEDAILRGVARGRATAYDVVRAWYRRDVRDPEGLALGIARDEMVRTGYAREVDAGRGAVAGFLLGRTRIEPLRDRIGGAYRDFEHLYAGWLQFCRAEEPLASALVESCRKAIRSRRESDNDN